MMWTMKRSGALLLLLIGLLLVTGVSLAAQSATPEPSPGLRREIYIALGMGDPVFEIDTWQASAAERDDRSTATWIAPELGALGYAEYLHFDGGYDPDNLVTFFDEEWFGVSFKEYDSWERTARCTFGDTVLHEFNLTMGEQSYVMRYWIQPMTPTRVLAMHLVFPADRAARLETYSERFAPLAWRCPR